jgi:hypothetical protein
MPSIVSGLYTAQNSRDATIMANARQTYELFKIGVITQENARDCLWNSFNRAGALKNKVAIARKIKEIELGW